MLQACLCGQSELCRFVGAQEMKYYV